VVFDLDDTLVASDSFARLLKHLLRRSPLRLILVALTAPAWLLLGARSTSRLHAERVVVWAVTVGLHRHLLEAVVRDFAVQHAGDHGGLRIDVAVQRLRQHLDAGDRVIIATACAEPLAREICQVLGLQDVEVVASTFSTHRWRLPHTVPARGHQKVQALVEAGVDLPVDHAYSESLSDLPLL